MDTEPIVLVEQSTNTISHFLHKLPCSAEVNYVNDIAIYD